MDFAILLKSDNLIDSCSVHDLAISDHYFLEGQINILKIEKRFKDITYRNWKNFDMNKFQTQLENDNFFFSTPIIDSLDKCTSNYNHKLRSYLDNQIPLITKSIKISSDVPWFSNEIRTQKKIRRRLEQTWKKTKITSDKNNYVQQRNLVKALVEKAKKDYYTNYVNKNTKNPQTLWSSINTLLYRKSVPTIPDGEDVANRLSRYFKNKIVDIRNNFAPTCQVDENVINENIRLSTLNPVSVDEIKKVIAELKDKSSPRDPIPTSLLKTYSEILSPTLCSITNCSLISGVIPHSEKISIITPIIKNKKGDKNELSNYRPVSSITTLSKIMEKIVYARLMTYLTQNDLLPQRQSAYRPGHSTETTLMRFHEDLTQAQNSGKITCVILLDSSAAFDTVDHKILIERLNKRYGIQHQALKWIENYLQDRVYSVRIKTTYSTPESMECGVPQGSVLGPVLYTLYTSPISDIVDKYNISHQIYADDASIYNSFTIDNTGESMAVLQSCILEIIDWYNSNRLKINPNKTELFISGSSQRLIALGDLSIEMNGNKIQGTQSTKLLGVKFDSTLTFKDHISTVTKSSYNFIRNLYKIRNFISESTATLIVNAFICSKIDYCNTLLYGCPNYVIQKLQNIQNSSVRLIKKLPKWAHISNERKNLHFLAIRHRISFRICCYVHKCLNNSAPRYLENLIRRTASASVGITLRSQNSVRVFQPVVRKVCSFSSAGPKEWNILPESIRNIKNFNLFKQKLKTYYFTRP